MIFLYFEDWSQFTFMLDGKGIAHGGRIIKVYTAPFDPGMRLNNPNLRVIESDDSTLHNVTFEFKDRRVFPGQEIEEKIAGLDSFAARSVRGLMRFSNREDLCFCQTGMGMKKGTEWLIENPLDDIDGISPGMLVSDVRNAAVHLDIFNEGSLSRLAGILDTSPGSKEMLDLKTGLKLKKEIQAELSGSGVESSL